MFEEVYYKELDENYEGKGRRILPYAVKCKDEQELEDFIQYLTDKWFFCVDQIIGQRALLVKTLVLSSQSLCYVVQGW